MRKFYLYLDDLREKPWYFDKKVVDYDSFVEFVKNQGKNIISWHISFDHDLGEGKNGYDCAKFLVEWCVENGFKVPTYEIHSANPVGADNIRSVFETYKKFKEYGKENDICD